MRNKLLKSPYIILLSVITLTAVCCDRYSEANKKMNVAESIIETHPDSALNLLDSIDPDKLHGKKTKARYALLMSMTLDKNCIDTTEFVVIQPAIDYYLKKGTADEKLKTYYYQGRIYQNRGENDSAMLCFMRGREFSNQIKDTLTLANLMVAQGVIYFQNYNFDDFININLRSADLYKKINRYEYEILNLENALDGCIVNDYKQRGDSIMAILYKRVNKHKELKSTLQSYILSYTVNFACKEDIENIISYYSTFDSIDDYTKIQLAQAYFEIEDYRNAKIMLDSIKQDSEFRKSTKYLATRPHILKMNGDYKEAFDAFEKYSFENDSVHLRHFTHSIEFAKKQHEMEKSALVKIHKRDKQIKLSLCLIFLLVLIAGVLFYNYRLNKVKRLLAEQKNEKYRIEQEKIKEEKERMELERHNAILEKRNAETECEQQILVAENLRLKISQLEEESASLKNVLEQQKDLSKPIEDVIKIRLEMLNSLLAERITSNDSYATPYNNWSAKLIHDKENFLESTRLAFRATHPKFMDYLDQHRLTEYEIKCVCLYAIGLRGKEISEYMNDKRHYHISADIRKKLGINENDHNLGIHIRKLMKEM